MSHSIPFNDQFIITILRELAGYIDTAPLLNIIVLAIVLNVTGHQFSRYHRLPGHCSVLFLLAYSLHVFFVAGPAQLGGHVSAVIRIVITSWVVLGGAKIIRPPMNLLYRYIRDNGHAAKQVIVDWWCESSGRRRKRREERERLANQQPTPPRSRLLERGAKAIKTAYQLECTTIDAAGLEPDELEAAKLQARQRMLQKLNELLG